MPEPTEPKIGEKNVGEELLQEHLTEWRELRHSVGGLFWTVQKKIEALQKKKSVDTIAEDGTPVSSVNGIEYAVDHVGFEDLKTIEKALQKAGESLSVLENELEK